MASETTFAELFAATRESAVHLEMRDGYMLDDPSFLAWLEDGRVGTGTRFPCRMG